MRASLVSLSALSLFVLSAMAPRLHAQTLYNITINTTGLNGTAGGLAFDLLAGDNATPNNTVLISAFATDGVLTPGFNTNTGTASGDLPDTLTLQDSAFSESFRSTTFGNALSFTLNLTNNFVAPGAPDEFSFFLTNADNTGTLVQTSDPTGADALFTFDSDGTSAGALTVFTSSTPAISYTITPVSQNVPEASSLASIATGVLVSICFRSRRKRHSSLVSFDAQ